MKNSRKHVFIIFCFALISLTLSLSTNSLAFQRTYPDKITYSTQKTMECLKVYQNYLRTLDHLKTLGNIVIFNPFGIPFYPLTIPLHIDTYYDIHQAKKIEGILKEILSEHEGPFITSFVEKVQKKNSSLSKEDILDHLYQASGSKKLCEQKLLGRYRKLVSLMAKSLL